MATLAYPGVQILDVTGPLEVFAMATQIARERGMAARGYALEVLAARSGPLVASSGLRLVADQGLARARGPFDTLLVAGGAGVREALRDRALLRWLAREQSSARRVAGVCSGAFLLAAVGLLDGRRATTHWANCDDLARLHPQVRVEPDRIFVRDGRVATSAGVTAGMDLALALVEEDAGRELALAVARRLVLFLKRPGGQSQFSTQLQSQLSERAPLRELQTWMLEHPGEDLAVEVLAKRAAMSPRHFARVFGRELGVTPARYVEQIRIEAARRRLEESELGLDAIAEACGFGSAETLRRAFHRQVHVSPSEYRSRFREFRIKPRVEGIR